MSASISISVKDVRKVFRKFQALHGVSLEFEAGKMHGIIGPEGSGKTTLLRIMLGLLVPAQGSVQYFEDGQPTSLEACAPHRLHAADPEPLRGPFDRRSTWSSSATFTACPKRSTRVSARSFWASRAWPSSSTGRPESSREGCTRSSGSCAPPALAAGHGA